MTDFSFHFTCSDQREKRRLNPLARGGCFDINKCFQVENTVKPVYPSGDTQQSFLRGRSAPGSKPLPFYIPFLIEKVPISYTFHTKLYPFHVPTERLLLNFSLKTPLKYFDELAVRCVCLRYFESN